MTYTAVEYTPTTFTVIAYYDKRKEPVKISRFQDHAKALKAIKQSLLTGVHADIIAEKVPLKDVHKMMIDFKFDNSINPVKRIASVPKPIKVKTIKTRIEVTEAGTYEIKRARVTFAPGVK